LAGGHPHLFLQTASFAVWRLRTDGRVRAHQSLSNRPPASAQIAVFDYGSRLTAEQSDLLPTSDQFDIRTVAKFSRKLHEFHPKVHANCAGFAEGLDGIS